MEKNLVERQKENGIRRGNPNDNLEKAIKTSPSNGREIRRIEGTRLFLLSKATAKTWGKAESGFQRFLSHFAL